MQNSNRVAKFKINEKSLEIDEEAKWIQFIFNLFKKYNIECIGRTPNVKKIISKHSYIPTWKEDEILKYLSMHPEIKHYCIIDDDDGAMYNNSDLNKVRNHLVKTINYSNNPEEEGLLDKHKIEVKNILKLKIKK